MEKIRLRIQKFLHGVVVPYICFTTNYAFRKIVLVIYTMDCKTQKYIDGTIFFLKEQKSTYFSSKLKQRISVQ